MLNNIFFLFMPYTVLFLTIVISIICVSIKRDHKLSFFITILGLIISLITSIYINNNDVPINVSNLFKITEISSIINNIIICTTIIICIFSYTWLNRSIFKKEEFYILLLLSTLGCLMLNISSNMLSLFVAAELISIPFCGLLACNENKKKFIESSWKYIIFSTVSSSILLLGITLIYSIIGEFHFKEIQQMMFFNSSKEELIVIIGFFIIFISILLKLSIFPFYFLTPDLYETIPMPSLMYYSTSFKTTFLFIIIKLYLLLINIKLYFLILLLKTLSFLSITIGSSLAIFQKNIKRLLGYASISHFGYLLIPFILLKSETYTFSLESILLYIVGYTLSNIIIFGTICIVEQDQTNNSEKSLYSYSGLFWKYPLLTIAFTIALLSSAGIPFTIGFINKIFIFLLSINNQSWWLTVGTIFGTVISLYYYVKIIKILFIKKKENLDDFKNLKNKQINYIVYSSQLIICFFSLVIIMLGIYPQILISLL
ncbi:NADH-quinone oxidoreductase subunit N [Buchnera aphidicola (Anoecia corni)]|uniref:NADH-quinone oxidoreductase subunit N n=1 Tax=Buchnera aphidicola (Anoecia corni) TaxID=2994477 RepID=A0AAT9IG28_9GAMM